MRVGAASNSISPERNAAACAKLSTGITFNPSTTDASNAFVLGTMKPHLLLERFASIAIDSTPLIGLVNPSKLNSPATTYRSIPCMEIWPLAASTPSATGKSKEEACFGRSPGAKLITTRSCGFVKPLLTIARSTRCVLSLTAVSGRPTKMVFGIAAEEISTSQSTDIASIPSKV